VGFRMIEFLIRHFLATPGSISPAADSANSSATGRRAGRECDPEWRRRRPFR